MRECISFTQSLLYFVVYPNLAYWITCLYYSNRYKQDINSRIQKDKEAKLDQVTTVWYLFLVLFNTIIPPLFATIILRYKLGTPICRNNSDNMIFRIIAWVIIQDCVYYFIHRALHLKCIYKYIHKIHHEISVPWAWSTEVQHPIDSLLTNFGTFIIAAEITQLSLLARSIVITYMYHRGVMAHIGVNTFWNATLSLYTSDWAVFHDKHHSFPKCNYGGFTTGIFDYLFKTDYIHIYKREKRLYSG